MSWSVDYVGTPSAVVHALENHSQKAQLSVASKIEYEDAMPHLVALVQMNFGHGNFSIRVRANGHAYHPHSPNAGQASGNLSCRIESVGLVAQEPQKEPLKNTSGDPMLPAKHC